MWLKRWLPPSKSDPLVERLLQEAEELPKEQLYFVNSQYLQVTTGWDPTVTTTAGATTPLTPTFDWKQVSTTITWQIDAEFVCPHSTITLSPYGAMCATCGLSPAMDPKVMEALIDLLRAAGVAQVLSAPQKVALPPPVEVGASREISLDDE